MVFSDQRDTLHSLRRLDLAMFQFTPCKYQTSINDQESVKTGQSLLD
jgi:hypothetical protein